MRKDTVDNTSLSLLDAVSQGAPDAWRRLDRLYRPFLHKWFCGRGVHGPDADDLTQDVLLVLMDRIGAFRHSGRTGAFRTWLRGVCTNRLLGYLRAQRLRGRPVGGADAHDRLLALADTTDWSRQFDAQHDRMILGRLFDEVAAEFAPKTMQAFRRLALDARPAPDVAAELELSLGAVYIAKSRVLGRLRELASGFLDETAFN